MIFYDVRSSDSSDPPSTPEQRWKIRRPTPDEDEISSLGSYTRTKPIPKKDRKVEELKLKHDYEIKSLRAEMERIRADQRRLQTKVGSVRTQSTIKSGDNYRSEERAARRVIPTEIFYDLPPRQNQLNAAPLTLHDLRTIHTADTPGHNDSRCHSSAVTGNPRGVTTSSCYNPFNSANVTTVLSYPSKSDAPIITTDIDGH